MSTKQKIYNRQFWLVCLSAVLFFASFNMMIPELPSYLTSLGGAEYKGLIIAIFTLTALLSRPFSGRLADKVGRIPVMMVGSAVCCLCSLIYPLLTGVAGFMMLRLVHGFSTGFTPTGHTAYLSDVVPPERRGEAIGVLGTMGSAGMAGGPWLGGLIASHFGLAAMFYCSSAFALLSIVILSNIRETVKDKHRFHVSLLKIDAHDLFEPRVLAPCVVMGLCTFAYGAAFTLLPDFGQHVGFENKGALFAYLIASSLVVRLVGGRVSDYWGREAVLRVTSFLIATAMLVVGFATTKWQLILGVSLYGMAHGGTSPTLLAWATDLSDPLHKGRGVASVYIFMELGIGLGALASAGLFANKAENFLLAFGWCSAMAALAFLYLMLRKRTPKPEV